VSESHSLENMRHHEACLRTILWRKEAQRGVSEDHSLGECGYNEACLRTILWEKPGYNEANRPPWGMGGIPTTLLYASLLPYVGSIPASLCTCRPRTVTGEHELTSGDDRFAVHINGERLLL